MTDEPKRIAVYAGPFDPLTYAEWDVVGRALQIFDKVILGIQGDPGMPHFLVPGHRLQAIEQTIADTDLQERVSAEIFLGPPSEFCYRVGAFTLVRELLPVNDLFDPIQQVFLQRKADPPIDTVLLVPDIHHSFVTREAVQKLWKGNGLYRPLVPKAVAKFLDKKSR